jgi:hypothetical protein
MSDERGARSKEQGAISNRQQQAARSMNCT